MVPLRGVYLPISKLHSILVVANLLAHNNISQICYCSQISLQCAAVNCSFSDNLTPVGVPLNLLAMENCTVGNIQYYFGTFVVKLTSLFHNFVRTMQQIHALTEAPAWWIAMHVGAHKGCINMSHWRHSAHQGCDLLAGWGFDTPTPEQNYLLLCPYPSYAKNILEYDVK